MKHVRNIVILMAIALAVVAVPSGGSAAALVGALFSLLIVALLAYLGGRFYRDHQIDIYGLGDTDRAILYVAFGAIVAIFAGSAIFFDNTAGTLIALALLAACAAGLLRVYRNWQRY